LDTHPTNAALPAVSPARTALRPDGNRESELKLLALTTDFERLRTAPAIARYGGHTSAVRQLNATYYDTPDRQLFRGGLSLRVRRDGRRYTQTLKRAAMNGQPFVRGEWEASVGGATPDLTLLPIAEIGAPFDTLAAEQLNAVFVTKMRRRTLRLDLPGGIVEIAFDDGSIEAGERRQHLTEIELELKAGDPSILHELGMQLLDVAPLRISILSKSDRGYSLAFGTAPKAVKATAPAIAAEHTVDDVIASVLSSCQHQLLANQVVADGGRDPEGVHQMRVALRRLRTACTLLGRGAGSPTLLSFGDEAKWLAQVLGGAREWDVLVTDTLCKPAEALAVGVDFDGLRLAAEPHRLAAYDVVRETLASTRYTRFNLSLRRWIECRGWRNEVSGQAFAGLLEPAPSLADRVLAQLHSKARKRGAGFRDLDPEARHRLRIALKKLRYGVEFFRAVYGDSGKAKSYVASLAKLQGALGHANDAAMTRPFLSIIANGSVAPGVHQAIGAIEGWQARDGIETEKSLRKHWDEFKGFPVFWSTPQQVS
jgi:triphosphatase